MALSKKDLGKLVKEARKLKSKKINKLYTQQMLANDISKSQSYIGDIESGRTYPSFVLLNQIASACGVSIGFFENTDILNKDIDKFIKLQLNDVNPDNVNKIREELKTNPDTDIDYIYDCLNTSSTIKENGENYSIDLFKTPEGILTFLLKQPALINFCGVDISKLKKDEAYEFVKDVLNQLKFISYKYKK